MSIINVFVEVEPGMYQQRNDAIKIGVDSNGYPVYILNPQRPVKTKDQAAKPPMQSYTGKIITDIYIKRFSGS